MILCVRVMAKFLLHGQIISVRCVIAGSRTITDKDLVLKAIVDSGFEISEIVCGECRGPDLFGAEYAKANGIPVKFFRPDWIKHGWAGGPIRNREMANYCGADGALILVHNGSKGSLSMKKEAERVGMKIFEVRV